MTSDAFSRFSCCLQYRSPGNAPAWDDGCAVYYFAALSEIPDTDAPILMKAVMTGGTGKFRPDPDEVLALWRTITKPAPVPSEEVAGRMLLLRREKGLYQRRIPDDPCCRWEMCEPPWSDPLHARVSAGMGGWTSFCEDNSPLGVLRSQLVKLTSAILAGADDTVVGLLRLEYQAANPPALSEPLSEPLSDGLAFEPAASCDVSRHEASTLMANVHRRAGVGGPRVVAVAETETAGAIA